MYRSNLNYAMGRGYFWLLNSYGKIVKLYRGDLLLMNDISALTYYVKHAYVSIGPFL